MIDKKKIEIKRSSDGRFVESSQLSKRIVGFRPYLEDEDRLNKIAEELGLSVAEIARESVSLGMEKLRQRLKTESANAVG